MFKKIFVALLLITAALPLAAQINDTYVIPAAANAGGAFGTRWMTQLSVFNPQLDYSLKVAVIYLPTNGGQGREALLTVPPNGTWFTDNALQDIFKIGGTGALLVATFPEDNPGVPNDVLSRSFLVTSNTFNNSNAGTYGQTIPGIWTGLMDYQFDEISAVAHGIRNIDSQGWRTNVGVVNLGRRSVTVYVSAYNEAGTRILNRAPFTAPPMGHVQDRLPVTIDGGSVEFFVDDPTQESVVFPYTSTIDQYSGDPAYQSPTLLATAKVLFPKKAMTASERLSPGKRITTEHARAARAMATSVGEVEMPERKR